jgi:hypothetical protein
MNKKYLKPHADTLFNDSSILFQQKNDKEKSTVSMNPTSNAFAKGSTQAI